jgi:hypothetical protein
MENLIGKISQKLKKKHKLADSMGAFFNVAKNYQFIGCGVVC